MRELIRTLLAASLFTAPAAQATFSIVAFDPYTGEVGSAVATCVSTNTLGAFVSRFAPGRGAINAQSLVSVTNLENGQDRLLNGDSAQETLQWLLANDADGTPSQRQYAIVTLGDTAFDHTVTFTGSSNITFAAGIDGDDYAIAGNILSGSNILVQMQNAFEASSGWLGDRLMAALQAAKEPSADRRCPNTSALAAYIGVSRLGDSLDVPYMTLNVQSPNSLVEPIDLLQDAIDQFKAENFAADTDDDGVPDALDNCTLRANPTQFDADQDGYGNACDVDFNNDCVHAVVDLGIFRSVFLSNDPEADVNGDGVVNVIDLGLFRTLYFAAPGPSAFGVCP